MVGAHTQPERADCLIDFDLSNRRFTSAVGVDGESTGGGITFSVVADVVTLYTSPTLRAGGAAAADADVTGRSTVHLVVGDTGDGNGYDHATLGRRPVGLLTAVIAQPSPHDQA